jgi:hypothetical protein
MKTVEDIYYDVYEKCSGYEESDWGADRCRVTGLSCNAALCPMVLWLTAYKEMDNE